MVIVYAVFVSALLGVVAGVLALVTGHITQGLALLVLAAIWALVGRASARRRGNRNVTP